MVVHVKVGGLYCREGVECRLGRRHGFRRRQTNLRGGECIVQIGETVWVLGHQGGSDDLVAEIPSSFISSHVRYADSLPYRLEQRTA